MNQTNYGAASVEFFPTRQQMGEKAATDAAACISALLEADATRDVNIIFAAAPSQNEVLACLCKFDLAWNRVNAFHMDEYLGLPAGDSHLFSEYLRHAVYDRLLFKSVHTIQPIGSPQDVCTQYSQLLREFPVDVVFLGIGENGHIAFNDPPFARFDTPELMKVIELETRCRQQQVNDGCFASINQVPTHALTVTIPALLAAKHLFCCVPASTKAQAVADSLLGEVTEACPASILRTCEHVKIYLDADSAALL